MDSKKAKKIARASTDAVAWTVGGVLRLAVKIVATVLLIIMTTGLLFTCVFAYYVKTSLSKDLDLRLEDFQGQVALTSSIVYRDSSGTEHVMQNLYGEKNTVWVAYDNIPKYMEYAVIAIEDKRFMEHKGVDWYRTVGAFSNMFLSMRNDFGGSTLTQQLIKNLTHEDDITVQRKLLEIFRALDFEKKYEKWEIMEWYLNSIFLGERCYGVGTAAQTYFGKEVWELSLAECAALVGITNNPSMFNLYYQKEANKERQETILYEMYDQGYITYSEYKEAVAQPLVLKRMENEDYVEPIRSWYEDNIIRDVITDLMDKKGYSEKVATTLVFSGGYKIIACLKPEMQAIVDEVYQNPNNIPSAWGAHAQLQSAIVIVDPYTGDVVAMSGGVGTKDKNFLHDRATIAQRPPGSSIKPIAVYGPALDLGIITQNTLVNDAPKGAISLRGTSWYPKNSGGGNRGVVTIRQAVTSSLNTVAAQTLDQLSVDESVRYLTTRLGVRSLVNPNDYDYAPLSLGQLTNGITVREMAQAYTAIANNGMFRKARFYSAIYDSNGNLVLDNTSEPVIAFQENTAWNMTDMLYNAVNAGTGTEARLSNMPVAGKTGTTSDHYDRYFVGFTPYYVAAVWTGYDMPAYMNFGSSNPAAVIWRKIMSQIHAGLEYKSFPTPIIGKATNVFGNLKVTPEETETPPPEDPVEEDPSPSITPTPSESETPTPTGSTSPTPTSSVTPTPSAPVTPTPSAPVTPTPTPTPTPSAPVTPTPTPTPPDPATPTIPPETADPEHTVFPA